MKNKENEIKENLQQFHGSEMFFQIPLLQTRFTDGLKYLANAANCYWLITDTSVIAKSLRDKSHFITIDFKRLSEKEQAKKQCEALIIYSDGNEQVLETHRYHVTDFPLDELRLFYVDNTLMLPSEY
jgi:ribosomal 30S subunit maturation factor RimM